MTLEPRPELADKLAVGLQVPEDAWMMDMVFSDTGDAHGGFYDSNNGLDYHVPVAGGSTSPVPLNVVHVSVEMAPIAKVCSVCCLVVFDQVERSVLIRGGWHALLP